jgi:hypothetical protein
MKAIRLLLLALSALMISCSSAPAPSHEAAQDAPESSGFSRESRGSISSRDSGFSSSSRDSSSSRPSLPLIPITDDYDDGLLDGEALSEEDRLAGKPGMQVGLDYDEDEEDDYEDGYDDGYEE